MQRKRMQTGTTVRIGEYWCVRYADWRIEDGVRIRKQGLMSQTNPGPGGARAASTPAQVRQEASG